MTSHDVLWTVARAGIRLHLALFNRADGSIECSVMNGESRVASYVQPTRDLACVWAEHLRQTYLADGWREVETAW